MPPRILLHLKEPKARLCAEERGAQESKVQLNLVVVYSIVKGSNWHLYTLRNGTKRQHKRESDLFKTSLTFL